MRWNGCCRVLPMPRRLQASALKRKRLSVHSSTGFRKYSRVFFLRGACLGGWEERTPKELCYTTPLMWSEYCPAISTRRELTQRPTAQFRVLFNRHVSIDLKRKRLQICTAEEIYSELPWIYLSVTILLPILSSRLQKPLPLLKPGAVREGGNQVTKGVEEIM